MAKAGKALECMAEPAGYRLKFGLPAFPLNKAIVSAVPVFTPIGARVYPGLWVRHFLAVGEWRHPLWIPSHVRANHATIVAGVNLGFPRSSIALPPINLCCI